MKCVTVFWGLKNVHKTQNKMSQNQHSSEALQYPSPVLSSVCDACTNQTSALCLANDNTQLMKRLSFIIGTLELLMFFVMTVYTPPPSCRFFITRKKWNTALKKSSVFTSRYTAYHSKYPERPHAVEILCFHSICIFLYVSIYFLCATKVWILPWMGDIHQFRHVQAHQTS